MDVVQGGSLFSSMSFGTARRGGAIPRPKNSPPDCFLNGLSNPPSFMKNKKPTLLGRFPVFGGGRWIRTTEVTDNRFTVCPLWPLGNSPASKRKSNYIMLQDDCQAFFSKNFSFLKLYHRTFLAFQKGVCYYTKY